MFQGGGDIPLILPILGELVARRHRVRVLVGPGDRHLAVEVVPLRVPDVHPFDDATLAERGWIGSWTPQAFHTVQREARTPVWAPAWAQNVSDELHRQATDLVVADFVLLGALHAAEAARLPHVALMHTVYPWPTSGVPAYGLGYLPSTLLLGTCRDTMGRAIVERLWVRNGLPPLNRARGWSAYQRCIHLFSSTMQQCGCSCL